MVSFFYTPRTDFAKELISDDKNGYKVFTKTNNDIVTTKVVIENKNNALNRKIGTYYSIEFESLKDKSERDALIKELSYELKLLLKHKGFKYGDTVLVVGLGNKYVTADALGPESAINVNVTNHIYEMDFMSLPKDSSRVCVLTPGVMGQTGMETSDIIKSINTKLKASFVIVIDALASMNIKRINKMIQITDTGISPGSGVGNKRKGIDKETLKTEVIAIGVATVVEVSNIVHQLLRKLNVKPNKQILGILEENEYQLVVTPKDIDEDISFLSKVISTSINMALHKNYSMF